MKNILTNGERLPIILKTLITGACSKMHDLIPAIRNAACGFLKIKNEKGKRLHTVIIAYYFVGSDIYFLKKYRP